MRTHKGLSRGATLLGRIVAQLFVVIRHSSSAEAFVVPEHQDSASMELTALLLDIGRILELTWP